MSSATPSLTILSEEQKFNGENLLSWTVNMNQLLGSKGLSGYIDGTTPLPAQPQTGATARDPTPIYSTTPSVDEWHFRDLLARGHITLNCTDVAALGVLTTGTAKDAWNSIQAEWGRSTDMRRSHAQDQLNKTVYVEGSSIQEHVKLLRTRKSAVDNLSSSVMTDEAWRGIIIRSIPTTPRWLPVIPSLYNLATSADIVSTLLAHGMTLDRGNEGHPTSGSSNTALAARGIEGCTNPNCKAKKRSTHTTANCYWPGGGKEGQFPPNFGQRSRANAAATSHQEITEHFVLSAWVPTEDEETLSSVKIDDDDEVIISAEISPTAFVSQRFRSFYQGKETPTFMDSGASNTMFVSKDDFVEYHATAVRTGDSAKAVDGNFEIVGEGKVTKTYLVDGNRKKITFSHALHTPTLGANLISISAFDKAGLTTTFGDGRGVIRKRDGSIVLTGKGEKGMYVVTAVNAENPNIPNRPIAMPSASQPTTLEQWHRRLTHCSPQTIQEMADGNLVDGLVISRKDLRGKCEDCILGRQIRRPFDNETERSLEPLELVSFDLWGPSRVQSVGGKIYFMPIIDAGTSFKHGAYLADKSDASTIGAFDVFRAKAESMTGRKVRKL